MTKELARYFVTLIDRDLHFSFNEMGLPSYTCEWLEDQLIQENFDKVEEFIQKRYGEHENRRLLCCRSFRRKCRKSKELRYVEKRNEEYISNDKDSLRLWLESEVEE